MAEKTVKDAVEKLPKDIADHIVRMFNGTNCLDLYEGDLKMYLTVIEQTASDDKKTLSTVRATVRAALNKMCNCATDALVACG